MPIDEKAFIQHMREMRGNARQAFRQQAALYLVDDKMREFANGLEQAIGEISVAEAMEALSRFFVEGASRLPLASVEGPEQDEDLDARGPSVTLSPTGSTAPTEGR